MPGGLVRWWPVESLRARQPGISWQGVVRTHHPFLPLIKQIQIQTQIQIQIQIQIHARMGLLARRRPHSSPFPSSLLSISILEIRKQTKNKKIDTASPFHSIPPPPPWIIRCLAL